MKLKLLFLSFLLAFGLFFSTTTAISAQTVPGSGDSGIGSIFGRIKQMVELLTASEKEEQNSADLSHDTVTKNATEKTSATVLAHLAMPENGAIAQTGKAIAMTYTQPASGETYVADLLYNMKVGPAQPAYAQVGGLGFAALEPVLFAWKQFRNIAYLFFIVITLIIGFMIMMRQKVGSQAAVTAQQAVPQIVIALITVTFSYAIAGFLIDMMYVIMFLFVGLFPTLDDGVVAKNVFQIGMDLFGNGVGAAQDSVQNFVSGMLDDWGAVGDALGWISGLTFAIVIAFAYLFAMVSLFFELLKTYISIIVSIVLSPLLLMLGALPGRSDVFKDWVMGIVANLVAFPVFLLLIVLHSLLTEGQNVNGGFLPPFLMGRGNADAITSLIGLSIMLISKDLVVQAKKSFNPKGTGIFEIFGKNLSTAVSKGWKGGEVIPGLGFTDTNKLPFGVGKTIGSGQKVASLGASVAAGGLVGAPYGAARNVFDRRVLRKPTKEGAAMGALRGAVGTARGVGDITGNEVINKESTKKASDFARKRRGGSGNH